MKVNHASLVVCNQILGTGLGITSDLYALLQILIQARGGQLDYDIVSTHGQNIQTAGAIEVSINQSIEQIESTDLVMLPAFWGSVSEVLAKEASLIPWLVEQYDAGALLVAHGTSVFFLAEAGLLDYKSATTHWAYFNEFEKRYPKVNLLKKRFITANDRLYCSGGISSAMDLGVHLVEKLWGEEIAKELDKNFLSDFKRGYHSQFIDFDGQKFHQDEAILEIQQWMELNYSKLVDLENVAQRFGLSLRSLKRRFKSATGEPPLQYMQRLRLERAKELLKHSSKPISQISFEIGYEDLSYFSQLFKRQVGVTPGAYRKSQ